MVTDAPAPKQMLYWAIAERFGWTLDYIKALPLSTIHEFLQIEDGKSKAANSLLRKK